MRAYLFLSVEDSGPTTRYDAFMSYVSVDRVLDAMFGD